MFNTRTTLQTSAASRYLMRLCKHWGHRFVVDFDEQHGRIDFGGSLCELQASTCVLHIVVQAPEDELPELEAVLEEHLQRLVPREQWLRLIWRRSSIVAPSSSG